jgi:small subunit ribosomal protein S6
LRDYETVFVLHPSYDEKEVEAEIQAVSDLIAASGGSVIEVDRWGRRRLAYEIKRAHEGIYTLIRWQGGPLAPDDIKRRFRLNERMLRYMTIFSDGPPPAPPRPESERADAGAEGTAERSGVERDAGAAPVVNPAPAETADGSPAE